MTWRDAIRLALSGLRGGIVRTVLTILGLGVGVGNAIKLGHDDHCATINVIKFIE